MLTKEQEQRLAVLISIYDMSSGTKSVILGNLWEKAYLVFDERQLTGMTRKKEPLWSNHLAFIRLHLVTDGYIDDTFRNRWRMTSEGTTYLRQLCKHVPHYLNCLVLTKQAVERAKEVEREFQNDFLF